jgi:hypothetical protein
MLQPDLQHAVCFGRPNLPIRWKINYFIASVTHEVSSEVNAGLDVSLLVPKLTFDEPE